LGEQIVRGIVEVTDDTDDTQNLVTFRDQADYIAHFLIDFSQRAGLESLVLRLLCWLAKFQF